MMVEFITVQKSKKTREEVFLELYKQVFPKVAQYISKKGGTFENAKDIFQEALILYYEKTSVRSEEVTNKAGYIFGVARHLWSQEFNSELLKTNLDDCAQETIKLPKKEPTVIGQKLLDHIKATGERCLEILKSFYYDKQTMNDLASNFGFATVRSATVQKYKCLEKVRDIVKQKSMTHEDFLD